MVNVEANQYGTETAKKSVYASAVDWWIAVLLMMGPVICAGLPGVLLQLGCIACWRVSER